MTWREYDSTMPGAPALNGLVDSLNNVMEAFLVTGFGTQQPAGWSMPYSAGNKRVFKPQGVNGYIQIDDGTSRGGNSPRVAAISYYETMTGVDAGTGLVFSGYQAKAQVASASARAWKAYADEYGFYLLVNVASSVLDTDAASYQLLTYYGRLDPFVPGDAWQYGGACAAVDQPGQEWGAVSMLVTGTSLPSLASPKVILARSYDGSVGPVAASAFPTTSASNLSFGDIAMRTSDDWSLSKGYGLHDSAAPKVWRCSFPSAYFPLNKQSDVAAHGSTGLLLDGPNGPGTLHGIKHTASWTQAGMIFLDLSVNRASP